MNRDAVQRSGLWQAVYLLLGIVAGLGWLRLATQQFALFASDPTHPDAISALLLVLVALFGAIGFMAAGVILFIRKR